MTIRIGSNIASLNAQRRLGEADSALSKTFERLSSGQRINRASDDAAGLAIASDLNSKSRIFTQAIRNINDGISVHAIADGTIAALSDITIRLKELAEQSANGTYSSKQRDAIDTEAQALTKEFFRVSRSAQFNGQKLFDGSLSDGLRLQVGVGVEGSILTHIGGKLGDGTLSASVSVAMLENTNATKLGDLNGDGILDLVSAGGDSVNGYATVRLGAGNGTFGSATSFTTEIVESSDLALGDVNGDGVLDLVTVGIGNAATYGNEGYVTVRLGNGRGSFGSATSFTVQNSDGGNQNLSLGDLNGDGILDIVTTGYTSAGVSLSSATVRLGTGSGSFGSAISFSIYDFREYNTFTLGDLNKDGKLDLVTGGYLDSPYDGYVNVRMGIGNGQFGTAVSYTTESYATNAVTLGDLNGDGNLDLVTAGSSDFSAGYATVRLGNANGTFGAAVSYTTEANPSLAVVLGDLNGDGNLDLISSGYGLGGANDGISTVRFGNGRGSFGASTSFATSSTNGTLLSESLALGDLNGDGVSDLVRSGGVSGAGVNIFLGNTRDGISPLQPFSLKTKADAL